MRIGIDARQLAGPTVGTRRLLAGILGEWAKAGPADRQTVLYCPQAFDAAPFPGMIARPGVGLNKIMGGTPWLEFILPALAAKDSLDAFWATTDILPLSLARSVPCLLTVHDIGCYKIPNQISRYVRLMYRLFFEKSLAAAAAIVCTTQATKNDLRGLGVREEKIHVVHPGVDERYFAAHAAPTAENRPYFLFVGHLRPNKNLERTLEAFRFFLRKCPEKSRPELILAGGRTKTDGAVMEMLTDPILARNVRHLGYVSENDLARLYRGAMAFVSPSIYEGFGLPYLEAMAAGIPVLAPDIPTVREVCGDAAFYANPLSIPAIADGFFHLGENPELRIELSKKGLRRAQSFRWSAAAEKVLDILRGIAGKR
ncbi:MAG: glycosyltransferase family 4 protein [Elusimicrobiota bacterium]